MAAGSILMAQSQQACLVARRIPAETGAAVAIRAEPQPLELIEGDAHGQEMGPSARLLCARAGGGTAQGVPGAEGAA